MPKFNVTIRATVIKTITVDAAGRDEAYSLAHDEFTTVCDGDERYEETTLAVEEAE